MPAIRSGTFIIRNANFDAPVGRYSWDDRSLKTQPIVAFRVEQEARLRFDIQNIKGNRNVLKNSKGLVVDDRGLVGVYVSGGPPTFEWIIEPLDDGEHYIIRCGDKDDCEGDRVWTLNLPTEPANRVHLETYSPKNPRQIWKIIQVDGGY